MLFPFHSGEVEAGDDSVTPPFFRYTRERYSWPEQRLLHSCVLSFDTNWSEIVVFSLLRDLAAIQWFETEKFRKKF
jgi:hypothetical protein